MEYLEIQNKETQERYVYQRNRVERFLTRCDRIVELEKELVAWLSQEMILD